MKECIMDWLCIREWVNSKRKSVKNSNPKYQMQVSSLLQNSMSTQQKAYPTSSNVKKEYNIYKYQRSLKIYRNRNNAEWP